MKEKEDQSKKITSTDWMPEGVYSVPLHSLSHEEKNHILSEAFASEHENKDEFISYMEEIISQFIAAKNFRSRNTPKQVKDRLERLQKYAKSLMIEIQELDEYSTQLLSKFEFSLEDLSDDDAAKQRLSEKIRGPDWSRPKIEKLPDGTINVGIDDEKCKGFTFDEAANAIFYINYHAGMALEKIKNHPKHRLKEIERHYLSRNVAFGLKNILDIEPTIDTDGTFSNLLRVVLEYAGVPAKKGINIEDRDVSGLVEAAIEDLNLVNE